MNGDRPTEPEDVPVPPRLAEALAALHPERVFVPPQVDEAILEQAREHLGKGRQAFRGVRPSSAAATLGDSEALSPSEALANFRISAPRDGRTPANTHTGAQGQGEWVRQMEKGRVRRRFLAPWLAAAASFAIAAWLSQTLLHHKPRGPTSIAREDINGDGRVDILDALVLSQQINRGTADRFDINGDGRVDQQDVQAVAAQAVSLEGGS